MSRTFNLRILLVSLFVFTGVAMGATAVGLTDDTPPAILFTDPQANPIVHLSPSIDRTITATTTPLCPYDVHLDGQWQGSRVASDGKVYFGTSTHAPHSSALFMQYDPATGQVHRLASLNEITGEDPNVYRPQGKLHSDIVENDGYLYFATYYGYEGGSYPGGHVIRYKLGSYEANAIVLKDMGRPVNGGIIYTAITADTINDRIYVNSNGNLYAYDSTLPDSTTFTGTYRGNVGGGWSNCFYHFTDSQGNLWTTVNGTRNQVMLPLSGSLSTFTNAMPSGRRADTLAIDPSWQYTFWDWGDRLDQDHWVFMMLYDAFVWTFDATEARQGRFGIGQAYKKVARIGVGGIDSCLAGRTLYFLVSARRWNSYVSFYGPNNPDTAMRYYVSDCKAKDLHLMSLNLDDPRLTAPGYDPNVIDPNLFTDWGRVVDADGRTPYRCEGMSSDGQRVYLTGDWRNLPTDPNNWHTLRAKYLDIDGGYEQIWRGQFFAVIPVSSNLAPIVSAGTDQSINLPNTASLSGTLSDDGQPDPPAACMLAWSKFSGPGTVTLASANALATTATFSTAGTYVLRLTASDSLLGATDDVQITVAPQPVNQAPAVSAGPDRAVNLPANSVSLAGTISDDGLPLAAPVTAAWSVISGPGSVTFANASAPATTATFSTLGTYVLRLTGSDTALSASDDCQVIFQPQATLVMALHLPFDEGAGATAADLSGNGRDGTLAGGPTWGSREIGQAVQFDGTNDVVTVSDFALSTQFSLAFWFRAASPPDGYHYMFSWGTVSNPNSVNVWLYEEGGPATTWLRTDIQDSNDTDQTNNCDVKDGSLVGGQWHHYCATVANGVGLTVYIDGAPRVTWAAVGGNTIDPNTRLFIGGRSDGNVQRFFAGGIDDLRIYSQALSAGDVLALYTGGPENAAPVASAGADAKVMMPNALALAGAISDDGLPDPPGACTAAWSKVSGTVTFANANAAATTATFSAAGTYVLRLTAADSELSGADDATVIVLAPGDFTGDGRVDGLDFLNWQSNYPNFVGGATPDGGDANGDGKVDGLDFLVWQANYQG